MAILMRNSNYPYTIAFFCICLGFISTNDVHGFSVSSTSTKIRNPAVTTTLRGVVGGAVSKSKSSGPMYQSAQSIESDHDDDDTNNNPIPNEWRGEILQKLSSIIDPDLNRDIVSLGFIQNMSLDTTTRQLSFSVELTTPACPIKEEFQTDCESIANSFEWTNGNAQVTMTAPEQQPQQQQEGESNTDAPYGLSQVRSIIAVSSCKGGVGKSTTAVNLAYALSNQNANVGIFDADVYGPSLPTMITPDNDDVTFIGRQIAPLQRNGVKLMSFGYVNEGSAIMRGPMVTQLLDQFLSLTYWGPLDYLILDMPPGTGDIQLTLSQKLNITAAVIVTTPQELSFVDVERGIEMFDSVNVPCVAVVENMAYLDKEDEQKSTFDEKKVRNVFEEKLKENGVPSNSIHDVAAELVKIVQESMSEDGDDDSKNKIFGEGHRDRLSKQWGIDQTFSVPLLSKIASNGDSGTPFVVEHPDSPQAKIYNELAETVVREVAKVQYAQEFERPNVVYDGEKNLMVVQNMKLEKIETATTNQEKVEEYTMTPKALRLECKCAACVEEFSGRQILQPEDVSDQIRPIQMKPTGNYALSVDWSDGHKSLYPYRQIKSLLEDTKDQQEQVQEQELASA